MSACRSCTEAVRPLGRAALLLVCCALLASCGFRQARILAEQGVKEFHDLLNREQYGAIYDASDDSLRKSMSRSDFVAYLSDIHFRLGTARKTTISGFEVNTSPGQESQVALAAETAFDRGTAKEQFLWRVTRGRAVLLEYRADIGRSTGPRTVLQPRRPDSRLTSCG